MSKFRNNQLLKKTIQSMPTKDRIEDALNIPEPDTVNRCGAPAYALADALTKAGLDLKDPTLQTNALLAQILIVANQILQQQNSQTGNSSLVESMIGLATGLTR